GVRSHKSKDASRDNSQMRGEERPGSEPERKDVADRPNEQQRATAQPVYQAQAHKSKNEIGHANADGLEQGGFGAQPGQFKDPRRKVEDGVDARKLVEEGDQNRQQDGQPQLPGPKMSGGNPLARGRHNLVGLRLQLRGRGPGLDQAEYTHTRRTVPFAANE